jgi:membrane protease YdiL (CAAX protease family)
VTGPEEAAPPLDPAARRLARRLTWGGVVLFWVVLWLFAIVLRTPLLDAILLAVLLAAVPSFSLAQVPLVRGVEIERMPAYWGSIVTLWVLGTACWLVGTRADGASAVGLVAIPLLPLLGWSLGLTVAALAVIVAFRFLVTRLGGDDDTLLRQLLPRTPRERAVFALLSVAAGFGEEMAYRGYAISTLAALTGVTGAAVITTVVFGILHAYQGRAGILRTGLMGGILAWGFLASGSLWPPIIAHTLVDLLAGIVLGERLLAGRKS